MHKAAFFLLIVTSAIILNKTNASPVLEEGMEKQSNLPTVRVAVAPVFIAWLFKRVGTAQATIEVSVNAEGEVITAKGVGGSPNFPWGDLSFADTAKQWRFSPSENGEKVRVVKITFVQRILPKGTPSEDLTTRYIAPYEIETRHLMFEGNLDEEPSITPEKPAKKNR